MNSLHSESNFNLGYKCPINEWDFIFTNPEKLTNGLIEIIKRNSGIYIFEIKEQLNYNIYKGIIRETDNISYFCAGLPPSHEFLVNPAWRLEYLNDFLNYHRLKSKKNKMKIIKRLFDNNHDALLDIYDNYLSGYILTVKEKNPSSDIKYLSLKEAIKRESTIISYVDGDILITSYTGECLYWKLSWYNGKETDKIISSYSWIDKVVQSLSL